MTDPNLTVAEFDHYATNYHAALEKGVSVSGENAAWFARRRIEHLADCLKRWDLRPRTVLDFGCGTGTAVPLLLELLDADRVIGVDVSEDSLEVARVECSELAASFLTPQELTERVDLAYCNGVFHHIPPNQRDAAMRTVADALNPGGFFSAWDNNPWSPAARYVMSRIPFDRDAIMLFASAMIKHGRQAGFTATNTSWHFIFPRSLAWLRPLEPKLQRLPCGAQYHVLFQKVAS